MLLKIQRSQRRSTFNKVIFCLDVRADYDAEERANINKYGLGAQIIYFSREAAKHRATADAHYESGSGWQGIAKGAISDIRSRLALNISVASLGRGQHIECKDMQELLEAEDTVRDASKNLTRYLEVANTFDGSEVVIEYQNGEEHVHVTHDAPALIEYAHKAAPTAVNTGSSEIASPEASDDAFGGPDFLMETIRKSAPVFKRAASFVGRTCRSWEDSVMVFVVRRRWPVTMREVRILFGVVVSVPVIALVAWLVWPAPPAPVVTQGANVPLSHVSTVPGEQPLDHVNLDNSFQPNLTP
ncbi:MAG: hypothetical protein ISS15_06940 [Alphaproteobacteria bacterium]|nr:hypothetical protein [Alphaproteobacteria bacterium]MBL7097374.1 hypothetical protein [Alphaproteobacteria bacterium]